MKSLSRLPFQALAVSLLFLSQAVIAQSVDESDADPLNDCNRRGLQAFESENKVYFYGGRLWMKNGTAKPFQTTNHYLRIVDFTKARDLNDSSVLSIKDIPNNIAIFNDGAFWADSKNVWIAGGQKNEKPWLARNGTILQAGSEDVKFGSYSKVNLENKDWSPRDWAPKQVDEASPVQEQFSRGAFAYNKPAQKAYYYGGVKGKEGSTSTRLLTFDAATSTWTNTSLKEDVLKKGNNNARFTFLPSTQSLHGGIGILLGGVRNDQNGEMDNMNQVRVYDATSDLWYKQQITVEGGGDPPAGRVSFCMVSASAPDNSSHSIYMYGGESNDEKANVTVFNDTWILTVPSFTWIRLNVTSETRKDHACAAIDQRYMLTYGGVPAKWGLQGDDDPCDQKNHGLRLFDMFKLAWTSQYDGPPTVGKSSYKVPKIVYDVIGGNEQGKATRTTPIKGFETAGLASLFQASTASPSTHPYNTNNSKSSHKTSVGAIAGGVLGGLAVLALILVGILLLLRHKRKQREGKYLKHDEPPEYVMESNANYPRELPVKWVAHEIGSEHSHLPHELPASRNI